MDWVPLESDYTDNRKIQKVRHKIGLEAQAVYTQLLCEISQKIDIDNNLNGYLETTGEDPIEYLSWRTGLAEKKLKEIVDTFAETGLICEEKWNDNGEVFIPQMLEENRAGKYLDQQKAGRQGGKKSRKGKEQAKEGKQNNPPYISLKGLGKGPVSGVQAERNTVHNSTLQYITKQNTDTKNTNPEPEDSEDFVSEAVKEVFDYFIEQSELTSHRKITSSFKSTLSARLDENWTVDEMKQVIDNYCDLLNEMSNDGTKVYGIHNNWSIGQLFSREEGEKANQILEDKESFIQEDDISGKIDSRSRSQESSNRTEALKSRGSDESDVPF